MTFGGQTYNPTRDGDRLKRQFNDVFALMRDGQWRTLHDIYLRLFYPEASISARLRDFRKPKFGAHTVEREHVGGGVWRYRLLVRMEKAA